MSVKLANPMIILTILRILKKSDWRDYAKRYGGCDHSNLLKKIQGVVFTEVLPQTTEL